MAYLYHLENECLREDDCREDSSLSVYRWPTDYSTERLNTLHQEIADFVYEISPSREEMTMRREVFDRVRQVIGRRWPTAQVKVFGSYKTDLYLPQSDIDIVVMNATGDFYASPLRTAEDVIRSASIAEPYSLQTISRTAVPIVKFVDKETKVKIDLSFDSESGLRSADKVKSYLRQYPYLDKLIMVVKYFLHLENLNDVYHGGMGSYSVTLILVSFLQHWNKNNLSTRNLGVLLIKFFELYGKVFDYPKGIRVHDGGSYFRYYEYRPILCIEDPVDPSNRIKAAWDMNRIKHAFGQAFDRLSSAMNNRTGYRQESILSSVVSVSSEDAKYRQWVAQMWGPTGTSSSRQYTPWSR